MPLDLSTALRIEKNAIRRANAGSAWLPFLDVTFSDGVTPPVYLVRNTEDIVYNGNTYQAFNFKMDVRKQTAKGEFPTVNIQVSNVLRIFQTYLESLGGAIGSKVKITCVNAGLLSEDYEALEVTYEVLSSSADVLYVTFQLGSLLLCRRRFPLYRYMADRCLWLAHYPNAPCDYAGTLTTCKGTLDDCRAHGNSARFGGKKGMSEGGIRVV